MIVSMATFIISVFFFFNDTATTEIYTLSLHDALPIWTGSIPTPSSSSLPSPRCRWSASSSGNGGRSIRWWRCASSATRSEEHTSELQSPCNLVCRLLLEKKNTSELLSPHHLADRTRLS